MKHTICLIFGSFLLFTLVSVSSCTREMPFHETRGKAGEKSSQRVPNTESEDRPVNPDSIEPEQLKKDLKAKFAKDRLTKELEVEVQIQRDVVRLNGFVASMRQKWQAEELAQQVAGVGRVENELVLRIGGRAIVK